MQTIQSRIDNLQELWLDYMDKYKALVTPYGMGHDMPDEVSQKATEVMNHAEAMRKEIDTMKAQAGIKEAPKPKPTNAKQFDLKNRDYKWAIHILAKLLNVPRLFLEVQYLSHCIYFLQKVEQDSKLFTKIADSKRYQVWFKKRYKVGLLFCIQSLQQGAAPKGKEMDWAVRILTGFTVNPSNGIAYQCFKDENFGDNINQTV